MKILISLQLFFAIFLFGNYLNLNTHIVAKAETGAPSYAKWGQIAMKEAKGKYPGADIIDYLHIGREKGKEYSIEKFKLWLQKGSKEFGLFIDIKFNNETEQIVDINFRETDR